MQTQQDLGFFLEKLKAPNRNHLNPLTRSSHSNTTGFREVNSLTIFLWTATTKPKKGRASLSVTLDCITLSMEFTGSIAKSELFLEEFRLELVCRVAAILPLNGELRSESFVSSGFARLPRWLGMTLCSVSESVAEVFAGCRLSQDDVWCPAGRNAVHAKHDVTMINRWDLISLECLPNF